MQVTFAWMNAWHTRQLPTQGESIQLNLFNCIFCFFFSPPFFSFSFERAGDAPLSLPLSHRRERGRGWQWRRRDNREGEGRPWKRSARNNDERCSGDALSLPASDLVCWFIAIAALFFLQRTHLPLSQQSMHTRVLEYVCNVHSLDFIFCRLYLNFITFVVSCCDGKWKVNFLNVVSCCLFVLSLTRERERERGRVSEFAWWVQLTKRVYLWRESVKMMQ